MVHADTLSREWILSVKNKIRGSDPGIIEKLLRAYYLCEQLVLSGLDFTFKGGTCLTFLTQHPRRFSTDVDIITQADQNELEALLEIIGQNPLFTGYELDERRSYKEGIPKAHYAMQFTSVVDGRNIDIQLDILFADSIYPEVQETPIAGEFIIEEGDPALVSTPTLSALMGDKLTAFAPTTVGVPFGARKEREIIKQLFDLSVLFDEVPTINILAASFDAHVVQELKYRPGVAENREDVLLDTLATCELITKRDMQGSHEDLEQYAEIKEGIRGFRYFTINEAFRPEEASFASAKVALIVAKLLVGDLSPLPKVPSGLRREDFRIPGENIRYNYLNRKLRGIEPSAQFYWYTALKILGKI